MATEDDGFISTSRLAKDLNMPVGNVFSQLSEMGLVSKAGDRWELTDEGRRRGGRYLSSPKFGTWIAWPKEVITVEPATAADAKPFAEAAKEKTLAATSLGRTFGIPATRMNYILSELGWIQKSLKGWTVTPQGMAIGGVQREDNRSGIPYALWPTTITANNSLRSTASGSRLVFRQMKSSVPSSRPSLHASTPILPRPHVHSTARQQLPEPRLLRLRRRPRRHLPRQHHQLALVASEST